MSKESSTWYSDRIHRRITMTRWGEVGTPVLIFPTAAGDAEEGERFHLIDAIGDLLSEQRVKAYSVDSVAGQAWLKEDNTFQNAGQMQEAFDAVIEHELVPAIRHDCGEPEELDILVAGASIGAFNALSAICKHPDLFKAAICMSGTYDIGKWLEGAPTQQYYECSPVHFMPHVPEDHPQLKKLQECFVLLTHGNGQWEDPDESWRVADILGKKGVPNRVDEWDGYKHDWETWREMLPKYLDELLD